MASDHVLCQFLNPYNQNPGANVSRQKEHDAISIVEDGKRASLKSKCSMILKVTYVNDIPLAKVRRNI